jgi:cytochrome c biogenesis protein ResB
LSATLISFLWTIIATILGVVVVGFFFRLRGRPWEWLASVRTGVFLIFLLALASVIGSVVVSAAENAPAEQLAKWWYQAMLKAASPFGAVPVNPTRPLALFYYSWWYKSLLLLVTLSMVCCSAIGIRRRLDERRRGLNLRRAAEFFKAGQWGRNPSSNQLREEITFSGDADAAARAFRKAGFSVATDGPHGLARKGGFGSYGSLITHLGLVLVLVAGFVSEWTSKEGQVMIFEGQATDEMMDIASARMDETAPQKFIPLGFSIRVEDFDTAFFPRTQIASRYVSTVSILDKQGNLLDHGDVEVNQTLRTHGWDLHQMSYTAEKDFTRLFGRVPRIPRYDVVLHQENGSGPTADKPLQTQISKGQARWLPELGAVLALGEGTPSRWTLQFTDQRPIIGWLPPNPQPYTLEVNGYLPNMAISAEGQPFSRSDEPINPAIHVIIREGEAALADFWLFSIPELRDQMPRFFESRRVIFEGPDYTDPVRVGFKIRVEHEGAEARVLTAYEDRPIVLIPFEEIAAALPPDAGNPADSGGWVVRPVRRVSNYVTVLSLTRNPAVPAAYLGCAILMFGMMVAFFVKRRELFFMVDAATGRLRVAIQYRNPQPRLDAATRQALKLLDPNR